MGQRVWHSSEYTTALRTVGGHRNAVYSPVQPLLLKSGLGTQSPSKPALSLPLWYILKMLCGTSLPFEKSRLKDRSVWTGLFRILAICFLAESSSAAQSSLIIRLTRCFLFSRKHTMRVATDLWHFFCSVSQKSKNPVRPNLAWKTLLKGLE